MFKELLMSVDISSREGIAKTITYLYSIMPPDPEAEAQFLADDQALMNLDYQKMGDPYKEASHESHKQA